MLLCIIYFPCYSTTVYFGTFIMLSSLPRNTSWLLNQDYSRGPHPSSTLYVIAPTAVFHVIFALPGQVCTIGGPLYDLGFFLSGGRVRFDTTTFSICMLMLQNRIVTAIYLFMAISSIHHHQVIHAESSFGAISSAIYR